MTRFILDDVGPGMILGQTVQNSNGQVLLGEGIILSEKHIRTLKMWGIMDVDIRDNASEENAKKMINITPELLLKAQQKIKPRFKHAGIDSGIMKVIFERAAVEFIKSKANR